MIGVLSAGTVLSEQELQKLLRFALAPIIAGKEEVHSYKNLIGGALRAIVDDAKREAHLKGATAGLSEEDIVLLFVLAPFGKSTWKLVDALGEAAQAKYWREVTPDWIYNSDTENDEAVERLMKAERPRAAFSCIRLELGKLDAQVLFQLLSAMAQGGSDQPGQYMLQHHRVLEAFKYLNRSPELTLEQKAGLEFAYIEILAPFWNNWNNYGIPNLEQYVEAHPELYVDIQAQGRRDRPRRVPGPAGTCPHNGRTRLQAPGSHRAHPRAQRPWRTERGSPCEVDRNRSPIVRRAGPRRAGRHLHWQGAVVRAGRPRRGVAV